MVGHQAALGLALARMLPALAGDRARPGEAVALEHDADGWVLVSARADTSARQTDTSARAT